MYAGGCKECLCPHVCVRVDAFFQSSCIHMVRAFRVYVHTCMPISCIRATCFPSFDIYIDLDLYIYIFSSFTYIHTYIWACVNNVNCCINCKKNNTKCEKIWYRKRWRSRKTKSACFILHPFLPNHWEHNTLSGTLECYHTFFCVYLRCLTSYKESSKICHCQ